MTEGPFQTDGVSNRDLWSEGELWRTVMRSTTNAIGVLDSEGKFIMVNERASEISGYSQDEMIGRVFSLVLSQENLPPVYERVMKTLSEGVPISRFETEIVRKDGSKRRIRFNLEPVVLKGDVRLAVGAAEDITGHPEDVADLSNGSNRSFGAGRIIAVSRRILEALDLASIAAKNRSAYVLLLGESGTGKGLVAEEIHAASARVGGPFVVVNCGAFSPTMIEAELFGHEKGAFTGAIGRKKGVFEQAHRGTLLLDEISELPLDLQVKLLRVVEKRVVRRLAGDVEIPVDVRIIAATNRDLEKDVRKRRFREDLYYRLNVIRIVIPPLRERVEDILPLSAHFVARFAREAGKHIRGLTADVEALLKSHSWPGNVRELSNVIESAVVIEQGREITAGSLKLIGALRVQGAAAVTDEPTFADSPITLALPTRAKFDDFAVWAQRGLIQRALAESKGNKKEASALLGLSRFQLNRRMKRLGLSDQGRE
jgi:PAS domain S-box-containing protein